MVKIRHASYLKAIKILMRYWPTEKYMHFKHFVWLVPTKLAGGVS
jgi:hypothetical protein